MNSLYGLAHNYSASGRFEQSISTWREYKELILEDYDSEDIKVLYVEMQIADIAKAQGDTEGALKLYKDLLPRYESSAGPDHPEVANLLSSIARTHFELGNLEEALALSLIHI